MMTPSEDFSRPTIEVYCFLIGYNDVPVWLINEAQRHYDTPIMERNNHIKNLSFWRTVHIRIVHGTQDFLNYSLKIMMQFVNENHTLQKRSPLIWGK